MGRIAGAPLLVLLSVIAGCATAGTQQGQGASGAEPDTLIVFAASSLTGAFTAIEHAFESQHRDTDVLLNLAGSQQLASLVLAGAPAHVFVSADAVQLERVAATGWLEGEPEVIATNRLIIAVPAGNPGGVTGLMDLARDDLTVVLAAEEVPLGRYTRRLLERVDLTVTPASLEPSARAVLLRVALGDADAGVVYASDATDDDVERVALADPGPLVHYRMATITGAPPEAGAFTAFVTSDAGQALLRDAGLGTP